MTSSLTELLGRLLEGGTLRVGELEIRVLPEPRECGALECGVSAPLSPGGGGYELRHIADANRGDLELHERYEAAREIALNDEAGAFRPLKTAPNLRRGWLLRLSTLGEVRLALDYLYPAMLGLWRDHEAGRLRAVVLRETLGRQSGMYAVTKKLTDEQAQATIGEFCRSDTGCLKRILWEISPGQPVTSLPPEKSFTARADGELPLLCHEACNLLVAKTREIVKAANAR